MLRKSNFNQLRRIELTNPIIESRETTSTEFRSRASFKYSTIANIYAHRPFSFVISMSEVTVDVNLLF